MKESLSLVLKSDRIHSVLEDKVGNIFYSYDHEQASPTESEAYQALISDEEHICHIAEYANFESSAVLCNHSVNYLVYWCKPIAGHFSLPLFADEDNGRNLIYESILAERYSDIETAITMVIFYASKIRNASNIYIIRETFDGASHRDTICKIKVDASDEKYQMTTFEDFVLTNAKKHDLFMIRQSREIIACLYIDDEDMYKSFIPNFIKNKLVTGDEIGEDSHFCGQPARIRYVDIVDPIVINTETTYEEFKKVINERN